MQAIQINAGLVGFGQNPGPPIVDAPNPRDAVLSEIARKTLCEFLLSMTLSGATCLFVATPAGSALLLAGAVSTVAVNLLIRCAAGWATLCRHELRNDNSEPARQKSEAYQTFIDFAKYLCPLNFSQLDTTTSNVIIHEGGHALAVLALYQDDLPEITVYPFEGGVTEFNGDTLSSLGKWIGEKNVPTIVAASGCGLVLFFALVQLIAGHTLSDRHPELSRYLEVTALVSILEHIFYAAKALLSSCTEGHDFYFLWKTGGIHPSACIALLVLLPLIAKIILYGIDQLRAGSQDAVPPQPLLA